MKARKTAKTYRRTIAIKAVPVNTVADIPRNLVMIKGEVRCKVTGILATFPSIPDGTLVNLVPHKDIKATVARASLGRGLQENYTSLALLMEGLNKLLWSLTTSLRPATAPVNYADAEVAVAALKKALKPRNIRARKA
jgi:hypothetical protein